MALEPTNQHQIYIAPIREEEIPFFTEWHAHIFISWRDLHKIDHGAKMLPELHKT
jgi:hypothetical protein